MTTTLRLILGIVLLVLGVIGCVTRNSIQRWFFAPTSSQIEWGIRDVLSAEDDIRVVAENLKVPWEIEFLPSGEMLVTERPGVLRKIGRDGLISEFELVEHGGEGGLLGMTLHPEFSTNHWIYLYMTTRSGDALLNSVERYRLENGGLSDRTVIIDEIPGALYHDGGRIEFGPDGFLYMTTGDAGKSDLAQDIDSLAGKILRLGDDGSIPRDNPFQSAVYSFGHRNSQGLSWDDRGRLWSTEHGRSGMKSGMDELNSIEKGKNYGWPVIQGDERREGMEAPVVQSGPEDTWAPAGAVFWDGSIFFLR